MNLLPISLDVGQCIKQAVDDVFGTMLNLQAGPAQSAPLAPDVDRISGSIGLAGENVTGAIYLHLTDPLARQAAGAMLGMAAEELGSGSEVNDVVGEMTNMVAGSLKSALCDAGAVCAISTPAIIRGQSFAIEARPDVRQGCYFFACHEQFFSVEVHLKLNSEK